VSFDGRLRDVILASGTAAFSSDDITIDGALTAGGDHDPNGSQNAIGAQFRVWRSRGLIEPTGEYVRSRAPHRKGGAIGTWRATPKGVAWAAGSDRLL
jgi:hypothetical protein